MRSSFAPILFLGLAALAARPATPAVAGEYSYRIWRTQEGLPQSKIQSIAQTSDAYLWIGTSGGLVRFDGVRFVVYDRSNTPALRDDSILSLCVAKDGSLWVGTEGGGLVHYSDGRFNLYGPNDGLTNLFVRALFQDRRGTMWVGTDRGVFRFEQANRLVRVDGTPDVPLASAATIFEERDGRLWLGGALGIFYIEDGRLRQHSTMPDTRDIHQTRDGALWFATAAGLQTLSGGKLVPHSVLAGANARQIAEDGDGNLWVGVIGGGLVRIRGSRATTFTQNDFLPDKTVLAMYCDRQENLWIGTQDGLVRLSKTLVSSIAASDGLADENVSTVYEDPTGEVWITTIAGGLYRFVNGRVIPYRVPGAPPNFRAATVFVDSHRTIWIGSVEGGIARIHGADVRFYGLADGMRNARARHFFEDSRGMLWIATGSGLIRWDGTRFHNYYLQEGLAYGSVRVLAEMRTGRYSGDLLVGTDGGLNRVHGTEIVRDEALLPFAGEKIWAIRQDRDGGIWIGTRGTGLLRWKSNQVTKFTTRDGLLSNSIYQILEDKTGRLWMSSPAGIFSADRKKLDAMGEGALGPIAVLPYGTAEGLQSSQMNGGFQSAGRQVQSGDLWFPSVKGVVRIDPNRVRVTNAPVFIESVIADDTPLAAASGVSVPAGSRKLEINYTACNLLSPERVVFRYKLEGFDEGWTTTSMARTAYYTNLRPGRYKFRVVATDATSEDRPSEATVDIDWNPRVYETLWFLALSAATAIGLGLLGLRLYAHQTQRRYGVMLAERTRLAREMHDTIIQGCVGVSTLLEAAGTAQATHPGETGRLLEEARTQVRITLDEAREAVWDLRNTVKRHGLASSLEDFAARLSAQNGARVETRVEGQPVALDEKADRSLLLVAREAIRNALAHAGAQRVDVCLRFDASVVHLEITDDGHGFEPAAMRGPERVHYGVLGMRERVENLSGSFEIRSAPGKGTTVVASVPLHQQRAEVS